MSGNELFKAINIGNLEKVKLLVERGADIEEIDGCGYTALLKAAHCNHLDIVKFLVKQGANINANSMTNNLTALHLALPRNNLEMIKFLVDNGADIKAKSIDEQAALDIAIKKIKQK